jgi:hypothetical protein
MKNLDNANLNSSSISLNNQKYTNQKNNNLQKTEIANQYQKDIIDISSSNSKTLIAQNGEKVNLKFDNNNLTITLNKTGVEHVIKRENLSENLKQISNLHEFNKFLDNSYAKITMLSDGELKVDVNQRLHGGMWGVAVKVIRYAGNYIAEEVFWAAVSECWNPSGTEATDIAVQVIREGGNFKTWVEHVVGDINHTLFFANKPNSGIGLGKHTQAKLISEATTIYQKLQIKFNELSVAMNNGDVDYIKGKSIAFSELCSEAIALGRIISDTESSTEGFFFASELP